MTIYNLKGLRVLNTRPLDQAHLLSESIKNFGGAVINCPAIRIAPPSQPWLAELPDLGSISYIIFTSANAVNFSCPSLPPFPNKIQVIAIGEATSNALKQYGINADYIPAVANSENLLSWPPLQAIAQQNILLIKGTGGRSLISDTLKRRGANLIELAVYQRLKPQINQQVVDRWWRNDAVDIILFTSHQIMQNIFMLFGEEAHSWLRGKPCVVLGERLAKEAARLGMKKIIISKPESILEALHQYNQGLIHGQQQ